MTAAITAQQEGLQTLVVEKSRFFGGSTALSGGAVWIPNNPLMKKAGINDSPNDALTYLSKITQEDVSEAKLKTYIKNAPKMIRFLMEHSGMTFLLCQEYPDYFPELPGALSGGRSLEASPLKSSRLGNHMAELNPPIWSAPGGLQFTAAEYQKVTMLRSTREGKLTLIKTLRRALVDFLKREKSLTLGQALMAQLRLALKADEIPLWLNCGVKDFVLKDDRVTGIIAEKENGPIRIKANRGVLLAAGGFARNKAMREKYHPTPTSTEWTNASRGNTGEMIQKAIDIGSGIALMDDAWWGPSSILPDGTPFFHVAERAHPGAIIVDNTGKRFVNEAAPYTEFVHRVYERNKENASTIPCYFIMDQTFRNKYTFGLMPPGITAKKYLDSGYILKANSLEELANKAGLPVHSLSDTIGKFNQMAQSGKDTDFGKGDSVYDQYYGDPTVLPNPCLRPLSKPPYYCIKLFPGDIGTKGGLLTDEYSRVLRTDSSVIEGLFAIGNTAASMMGHSYPGAGGTIGPAMTFGYIAAKFIGASGGN